nr:hypothetical protein [Tanacetum cinerariifolium]
PAKVGETGKIFGRVTTLQLADALKAKGIEADRKRLSFDQEPTTAGAATTAHGAGADAAGPSATAAGSRWRSTGLATARGTAWAYRLRETGELVSNLHKLPAGLFEKELLTADEIVNGLAEVHALLRRANPAIRIVLTVSPVRHIKDTLPLNA